MIRFQGRRLKKNLRLFDKNKRHEKEEDGEYKNILIILKVSKRIQRLGHVRIKENREGNITMTFKNSPYKTTSKAGEDRERERKRASDRERTEQHFADLVFR